MKHFKILLEHCQRYPAFFIIVITFAVTSLEY